MPPQWPTFLWVCKHIRDSIRYLHSNPETTYSQLMVATRNAESEMEDAKEKVRARSSTATEVTDSSKELGDQITRLMATLTTAEWALTLLPLQTVPGTGVIGEGGQTGILLPCPSSHNGQTGLGQSTSAHSYSAASGVATASQSRGSTQALTGAPGNAQNTKDPNALQYFRCQG